MLYTDEIDDIVI